MNATTGALLWQYMTANEFSSSPAVANGVVYVGSSDHSLYALDASTGALLWKYTTGGYIPGTPVIVNGKVYASSTDFSLYAFHLPGQ